MSTLLVKPRAGGGRVHHVTPKTARWTHVGFDLWKRKAGELATGTDGDRETCLVFVSGRGSVRVGAEEFGILGGRSSPFEGRPWSVYVPPGMVWSVEATEDLVLAVCSAPGKGKFPPRVIAPDILVQETRGKGSNVRHVTNILPEWEMAENLLVVEVETYYHRLNPPQGFAFQRVYTDDRELDEAMAVEDGDVTLVPRGYHPCAAIHGYELYYLNVMAGPRRTWKFHNAKEHEWLLKV
jgi:5-deoxy-glucuronate isomerase